MLVFRISLFRRNLFLFEQESNNQVSKSFFVFLRLSCVPPVGVLWTAFAFSLSVRCSFVPSRDKDLRVNTSRPRPRRSPSSRDGTKNRFSITRVFLRGRLATTGYKYSNKNNLNKGQTSCPPGPRPTSVDGPKRQRCIRAKLMHLPV